MNQINLIRAASFAPKIIEFPNTWVGHLPFAAWVTQESSPKTFVELGIHTGNSYFSFCQSVVEAGLLTKCYAIDTWKGDEHSGQYGDEIFARVNAHHQEHYAGFSRLLRLTFDDAVTYFADQSIDMLHIDGLHSYESIRHNFETWLPKLAPGAVVLFHDTNVRERSFGVWRFWEELQAIYPSNLEFVHSYGLGVLQLNNAPDEKRLEWLQPSSQEKEQLIKYFAALGCRQLERYELIDLRHQSTAMHHHPLALRDGQIDNLQNSMISKVILAIAEPGSKHLKAQLNGPWYGQQNPDILAAGADPYEHWLDNCVNEGRLPTSDTVKLAQELVLEREQLLRTAIEAKERDLRQLQFESLECQRSLEAEIIEVKLKARDELHAQLRTKAERGRAFVGQLTQLRQAASQEQAEQIEAARQQLSALTDQHTQREQLLCATIEEKERELVQIRNESQERQKATEAEIFKIKLKARDEIHAQLRIQAERERDFAGQLAQLEQTHRQEQTSLNDKYLRVLFDLNNKLVAIQSTLFWRLSAPLRSFCLLIGIKLDFSPIDAYQIYTNSISDDKKYHEMPKNRRILSMTLPQTSVVAASLDELLSYHDERFIHCAYHTLLGRTPDPEGFNYYLRRVRSGISKVEILAQLRLSKEGKSLKVKLAGLDKAIRPYKWLKLFLLGPLLQLIGLKRESNLQRSLRAIDNNLNAQDDRSQQHFVELERSLGQLETIVRSGLHWEGNLQQILCGIENKLNELPASRLQTFENAILEDSSHERLSDTPPEHGKSKPPSWFDAVWYLEHNPDVVEGGMDTYEHYLLYGKAEGRMPAFDKAVLADPYQMLLIDTLPQASRADGSIAVHLHMYYHDLANEFAQYLKNMPFVYDLYVSTASEEGTAICRTAFSGLANQRLLIIEQVPNHGRDIAPMFCTFGSRLKGYDYIAHLHSKKSLYNNGATEGWREYLCDKLLGSKERIRRIFMLMQGDAPRGIVYPQNYAYLPYQANTWLANKAMGSAWCVRLGISPIPQGYFDFPAGSMFWAKGDALKPLFDTGITLNDFPKESGQTDGTFAHCLERLLVLSSLKQGYKPGIIKDLQHPTWSAWGFHHVANRPFQYMINQLADPAIKLIAFDIFDTLLCRPLLDPESIKAIVAERIGGEAGQLYIRNRPIAEQQAREAAGKDVGMAKIFACLGKLTGLSDDMLARFRSLEENIEKASLSPRPGVVELYRQALDTGKPVALVSDMFLPRTVIEECLYSNRISGWDMLFLSNEIGLRKDTGELYDYVFDYYGITPAEMLMIGDNERSDVQIPCDKGVVAMHILKPVEFARGLPRFRSLIETNERSGNISQEMTLGLVVQDNFSTINFPTLDTDSLVQPTAFNVGYSLIGPLLVGFSQWLVENARNDGIERLYFLAREGQLIKRVYDIWSEGLEDVPEADYLIVSRRAVSVPTLESLEDILSIAKATYFSSTIGNFLFERYGLQLGEERWKQIAVKLGWGSNSLVEVHNQQIDHLLPLLTELNAEIIAEARLEYSAMKHYLKTMKLENPGRQAVVDIGYGATIQGYLNRLVATPVHGYYMMTDQRSAKVTEKHKVIIRGCYLHNVKHAMTSPLMYLRSFELEKLLSSNDAQVIHYKMDQANDLTALYRELSNEETAGSSFRMELQSGAIRFASDAKHIRERIYPNFKPSSTIAKQLYEAFIVQQSQMEKYLLLKVALDDHYSGRGIVR